MGDDSKNKLSAATLASDGSAGVSRSIVTRNDPSVLRTTRWAPSCGGAIIGGFLALTKSAIDLLWDTSVNGGSTFTKLATITSTGGFATSRAASAEASSHLEFFNTPNPVGV